MLGLKSNKIRDVHLWFKQGLAAIQDERERAAVTDEVFLRALDLSRDQRVLKADERLSETSIVKLIKIQKRLSKGEPVQYVTGVAAFMDMLFHVRPGVLIPRHETEGLVHLVLGACQHDREGIKQITILDAGTGSGCIAISLKAALPDHNISACDNDDAILQLAKANAEKNNVQVNFFRCNILNKDEAHFNKRAWHCIVSNPPYVRQSEKASMKEHVVDHEPGKALFVPDEDPLRFYKALAEMGKKCLYPAGRIFFEINEALAEDCRELVLSHGFTDVCIHNDIHEKKRYLSGKMPS